MRGSRGGDRGSGIPPSLKNHKNIGFPSNIDPDPLKLTKLPSQHSMVGHYRHTSETPCQWRFAGRPMMAHFQWHFDPLSIPSTKKKSLSVLDLSGSAHEFLLLIIVIQCFFTFLYEQTQMIAYWYIPNLYLQVVFYVHIERNLSNASSIVLNCSYSHFCCCYCCCTNDLILNAPNATKIASFSRLLECLRSLYCKQCGPRSDCSYRSSLFWVLAVGYYA